MSHIFTTDTLLRDSHYLGRAVCPVCEQKSRQYATWVNVIYLPCKHEINDEWFMGDIVMARRKYMKLNRPQMGKLTGLKPASIKHYEFCKCPKKYFDLTTNLIKIYVKDQRKKRNQASA